MSKIYNENFEHEELETDVQSAAMSEFQRLIEKLKKEEKDGRSDPDGKPVSPSSTPGTSRPEGS